MSQAPGNGNAAPARQADSRQMSDRAPGADPPVFHTHQDVLATVLRNSPLGIALVVLEDWTILNANESLLRLLGSTHEEILGQSAAALGLSVDPTRRGDMVDALRQRGRIEAFEVEIRTRTGQLRQFLVTIDALPVNDQECALLQVADLTWQRQAEAARDAAEAQYRALVEQIPVLTYTEELGDTNTYRYLSPQVEPLLGYSPAEVLANPSLVADHVHPDDRERVLREGERTTLTGDPFRMVYRLQARDGRWVHVRDEAVLVYDEAGRPLYWQGVLFDVTEQREAEAARRESERRSRAFVDSALDCVIGMDREGFITEFNPAATRTFGYDRAEAIGQQLADLIIPPDFRKAHQQGLQRLLETGHGPLLGKRVEMSAMRADESVFPVELTIAAVDEPGGQWYLGFVRDISSRFEYETAMRANQERFRSLVQHSHDAITVLDPDGTRRYVSPSLERLLGYQPDDLTGGNALDLVHPEDLAALRAAIRSCVEGTAQTPPLELRFKHRDGTWRFFETVGTNLLHDPNVKGIVFNSRSLTARKETEAALRESEQRFRSAFDHAPIGLAIVARDGQFRQVNRSLTDLVGYEEDELLAMTFQELTHPDDLADDLAQAERLWAGEIDTYQLEKRYLHKDGQAVWIQLTVSAVRDEGGAGHAIAQIEDISARRHLDLERATMLASEREYTRQLRELTQTRADLTAMIAHELRSPVAAMRILTSMLEIGELDAQVRAETVASISAQIDQLDRLVSDVAASAVAERDDFSVQLHPVSLAVLLDGAAVFALKALRQHAFAIGPSPDVRVWCDPERISQVLLNLLDNAAKHTPPGTPVTLSTTVRDKRVTVEVANQGPLISAEEIGIVFEKFARGRTAMGGETSGAGLGLYLSRQIVDAHGSELIVESSPRRGTVFSFDLRLV